MNSGSTLGAAGRTVAARIVGAVLGLAVAGAAAALDLNTAIRADIERLEGVGVATADRVLAERDKAPFQSWADFTKRVKGFRASRLQQLRQQGVTIRGELPPVPPPDPAPPRPATP